MAKVKLNQHPDYAGVRGTITRDGDGAPAKVSQLAGDIDDDGMLSLDESLDGHAISGVWLGALQAGVVRSGVQGRLARRRERQHASVRPEQDWQFGN